MRHCEQLDCGITSNFNYPEFEGIGRFCKKHAKEGMVDVKNRVCDVIGCRTRPHFNYPGNKKGIRCLKHSEEGMINVVSEKCLHKDCDIIASFNFVGKKGLYCFKHAKDGMVCVYGKRCLENECYNRAGYGFDRRMFCKDHKEKGMKYIRSEKRKIENQEKSDGKNHIEDDEYTGINEYTGGSQNVRKPDCSNGNAGKSFRRKSMGNSSGGTIRYRRSKLVNWEVVERILHTPICGGREDQET